MMIPGTTFWQSPPRDDRFLVMENVTAPELVAIDPSGTVPVTVSAKKLDNTPLNA